MNLSSEFADACHAVCNAHLNRLRDLGVLPATIASYPERFGLMGFGVLHGAINEHGYFLPGSGPTHIVQPVSEGGNLVDMVAWRSTQPYRWGLLSGTGWALGADNLANFGTWANYVVLHDSPLDWLRADCEGGCVIDWDAPEVEQLADWARIDASPRVANVLRPRLERPRQYPEIISKEARNAA